MHVTLRQLAVLESVARNLSFTKAAKELHLTQPAVSMQIKQVEESLGIALFEQVGKKIYLTAAGIEMYHCSRNVQHLLAEGDAIISDLKGVTRGQLSIAVASTANYFAPRILAAFREQYKNIDFRLDVTNRKGLIQHLDDNDTDLVIMGKPPDKIDVSSSLFMDNPLVAIAPLNHPLVKEKTIPLQRLSEEIFIIREQDSGTRIAIERFFATHGAKIKNTLSMSSNEAIKQAVEAGLGLGIVSIHTLEMELTLHRLAILNAKSFPILRHWYIVHRKGKRLSPAAEAFKLFITKNAKDLMQNTLVDVSKRK